MTSCRRGLLMILVLPVLAIAQQASTLRGLRAEGGAVLTRHQVRSLLVGAEVSGAWPAAQKSVSLKYGADNTAQGSAMSSRGAHLRAWARWSVAGDGRLMLNLQMTNGAVWSSSVYVVGKGAAVYFVESLNDSALAFEQEIKR